MCHRTCRSLFRYAQNQRTILAFVGLSRRCEVTGYKPSITSVNRPAAAFIRWPNSTAVISLRRLTEESLRNDHDSTTTERT
jgi:hypothetical protein